MINQLFVVISLLCLCFFLYGIIVTITDIPENACKMTYMYSYPQFIKVNFLENDAYPKYNLYAYAEGHLTEAARNMQFTGAPVIFIPGNSGSYKQVRSLASVALRKGLDNNWIQHLDYFTVDLNEEYSGFFGPVLADQTRYVEHCIKVVLQLYKKLPNASTQVVLIGHSMGGKIAQALATNKNISSHINTILTLSAPMNRPVLALDSYTQAFYQATDKFWLEHRETVRESNNETNSCRPEAILKAASDGMAAATTQNDDYFMLNNKLLVTIGGGSRDLQVHSALTNSKFSDIHAITTKIPNVWVSTDHLCAVWCLQLVQAVNRFLYGIIEPIKGRETRSKGQRFIEDKQQRLTKAQYYFNDANNQVLTEEVFVPPPRSENEDIGDWHEDIRRVFSEKFKTGLNRTRVQMIRLVNQPQYKFLKVEVINLENDDWVFGCAANDINGLSRYCEKATSLSHFSKRFPTQNHKRHLLMLDLHKLKAEFPSWTHVLLRFRPTEEPLQFNIDIHNPGERESNVPMPKWYSMSQVELQPDTMIGSSIYYVKLSGMEEPHQTVELRLLPRSCSKTVHQAVAKLCVPWMEGFERYHFFSEANSPPMYVYPAAENPARYNTTLNPIHIELHLDPSCRYQIVMKQSFGMTMARIVQHNAHWLFAHMVAIILLSFKHQISLTPANEEFKCGALIKALGKCTPFFIITASRVFAKMILWFKEAPQPESYDLPMMVSILIHGSALALLTLATGGVWAAICFCGNVTHKILFKLIHLPIPAISSILIPIIEKFPLAVAGLLLALAFGSCGGIALVCASVVYFVLLTKMYEDYLEEFVYKTAKLIAKKLFGKLRRKMRRRSSEASTEQPKTDDKTKESSEVVPSTSNAPETEETKAETDEQIKELLKTTREQQAQQNQERDRTMAALRAEYDSVHAGLSDINFHLPIFFLLLVATVLNLPSVITWAKNFQYATVLHPDPSQIPAVIILVCLSIIWQLATPRNVQGYKLISSICYIGAVLCVLYCQNSIYRLNYIISAIYVVVTLQQVLAPKVRPNLTGEVDQQMTSLDALKTMLKL